MKRKLRILRIWWFGKILLAMRMQEINYINDRHIAYIRNRRWYESLKERYSEENFNSFMEHLFPEMKNKTV